VNVSKSNLVAILLEVGEENPAADVRKAP